MPLKPGVKSVEFWLSLAAGLAAVSLAALDQMEGAWVATAAGVIGAAVTIVRSTLAAPQEADSNTKNDDESTP